MEQTELRRLQTLVRERKVFEFSNFEPWQGKSLEHLYQAFKSTDQREQRWVLDSSTPGEAKRRGRQIVHLKADWDKIKLARMYTLLHKKFSWGTEFAQRLIKSQGEIVEWNIWHDLFWGKCVCDRHKGEGENWLGILLMLRRSLLWASA